MSFTTALIKRYFAHLDNRRDRGLQSPPDVLRRDDIPYGADLRWNRLDVYRPKALTGPLPVIVSVHGGGWIYADKERYQYYCLDLASRGFAVVNFTYRLAPQFPFPAGIEDTNQVFSWLLAPENVKAFGFDTDALFAVGDSAGGQMLSLYAAIATNPELSDLYSFTVPKGLRLRGIGLNCGIYEVDITETRGFMKAIIKALIPRGREMLDQERFSAVPYITKDYPTAFVMTANKDSIVPAGSEKGLLKALEKAQVQTVYKCCGSDEKPLDHVFHLNVRSGQAREFNDEQCAFFHSLTGGK